MSHITRRKFIQTSTTAGIGILGAPAILSTENKGDKLRVAFIGTGGINKRHIDDTISHGDICGAYCDVDANLYGNIHKGIKGLETEGKTWLAKQWKAAKPFQDYREMFDKAADSFDAVMIGTPDHSHYPATVLAMEHGKHVFTQKPLTHTVWEARQLAMACDKYKLATQMGNQGHANEGNRQIAAYVQGGHLGDIKEIHCFTNRPVWPQGFICPPGGDPVPESLDWQSWLGPAAERPFLGERGLDAGRKKKRGGCYHQFNWRGWLDFGGGALADMACHTMDSIFMSLDPGFPTHVEALNVDTMTDSAFPKGSTLKWTFGPTATRPGFDVYWYDGTDNAYIDKNGNPRRHERLEEIAKGAKLSNSGNIYVGTERTLLVSGDYGDSCRIIPDDARIELAKELKEKTGDHRPARVYEPSIGHHTEFREAAIGNKPYEYPGSNFKYAGPFTETIQLGNVCLHFPGKKLKWDGPKLRFKNSREANKLINKEYREGWDFKLSKV
ncbi:Gfo/Idh/MocA family oxidoreductase [Pelagicoccus mobilis]|uniref:Gfo/Idh/MocA family oxidoreductase n=1 Tax=Pelagicoccus mobilis TaxID=415221 RepID=A0A934RVW2_9BACT|nr:Gfo/Idh/MocA family oxidoreductase [Pelagicoccus mobilis]MBK1877451.1 Gfo/Idh/MocA family oxidoreductase [Pelagicoccus mobilis]